jgi:hypothetical protein
MEGHTMLQIIGWMLCIYLVVKCCELIGMKKEEGTFENVIANIGAAIALIAAPIFWFLINAQVNSTANNLNGLQSQTGYSASGTSNENANQTLEEANKALANAQAALNASTR